MRQKLLLGILAAAILFIATSCQKAEDQESDKATEAPPGTEFTEEEDMTLGGWNGVWNSLSGYLEMDESFYTDEDKASITALRNGLGKNWEPTLQSDLISIQISDTNISVFSELQESDGLPRGNLEMSLNYSYMGTAELENGEIWHQFELPDDTEYKFFIIQPVKGGGKDELQYFQFRYGSDSFEALLSESSWTPVMVSNNATPSMLQQQFA